MQNKNYFFGQSAERKAVAPLETTFETFALTLAPSTRVGATTADIDALPDDKARFPYKNGAYFTPCAFNGTERNKESAIAINLICLDVDDPAEVALIDWQALAAYRYVWYETFSSRPQAMRLRIAIDTDGTIPLEQYAHAVNTLGALVGLQNITVESRTICQAMFLPKVYDDYTPQHGYSVTGIPLSLSDLPAYIPPAAATIRPLPENDPNIDEIARMLSLLDADCGRQEWRQVALGLRHEFHADEDTGLALFDQWSATGASQYDAEEVLKLWNTIQPSKAGSAPVTLGSIIHMAKEEGYNPSATMAARVFGGSPVAVSPAPLSPATPVPPPVAPGGRRSVWHWSDYGEMAFPQIKSTGKPKTTMLNVRRLLECAEIDVRYNLMSKKVDMCIPDIDFSIDNRDNNALAAIRSVAAQVDMAYDGIEQYLGVIADDHSYHPVREWLDGHIWDGQDRIQPLTLSLNPSDLPLANTLVRRWAISAIAAVYDPNGIDTQGMLMLQGDQGIGKTRWFRALTGDHAGWRTDGIQLDPSDKDSVAECISYWMVELGETDATFNRAHIGALKSFITRRTDEFRKPFARLSSQYARRTVFLGTINPQKYLQDDTGNRRFWTVACGTELNADHGIDVHQLWLQAKALYESGERWYLSREESDMLNEANEEFEAPDPFEEGLLRNYDPAAPRTRSLQMIEIANEIGVSNPRTIDLKRIGAAVRKVFGIEKARKSNGKSVYDLPEKVTLGGNVTSITKAQEVFKT